jgi:hypothetical protein
MNKVYGYPILPKAGLANMLIPWAECFIWCHDNGIMQIAPFWHKARIGPYLRRERDKRQYQNLFTAKEAVTGIKRLFLVLIAKKINSENFEISKDVKQISQTTLVCFSDMNHLERLIGRQQQVLSEIYRITRPELWPKNLPVKFIGIHIRLGDFPLKSEGSRQIYFRQPVQWYIGALKELKKSLKTDLPVLVFSDGTDQELSGLLEIEHVSRSPYTEAISDLLAIAHSLVLITSRSSFSLFGAFLGQTPTIWYQGKTDICGHDYLESNNRDLAVEWMPGNKLPERFLTILNSKLDQ